MEKSGGEEVEETVNLYKCLTAFFDCLNVNDYESGKHSQNSFKDLQIKGINAVCFVHACGASDVC